MAALALTHVGSEQWLQPHLDVPEDFYELMKTRSSTRIEVADNALLGVINDVAFFSTDVSTSATMILYVTARIMVSARTTQLRSVDRLRSAVKRGEPFRSPADLLAHEADQPSMRPVFSVVVLTFTGAVSAAGMLAWSHYRRRIF